MYLIRGLILVPCLTLKFIILSKIHKNLKILFRQNFIGEGQDQTRAWFYYLHIISTAVTDKICVQKRSCHGIILAEDGKK